MKSKILLLLAIIISSNLFYAQKNPEKKFISKNFSVNGKNYTFNAVEDKIPSPYINKTVTSPADWQTIMSEDFEGTFPSGAWNIISSGSDAYWGQFQASQTNNAAWCAASGSEASIWGFGYINNMSAWMIYGPFDLSDATDAKLDFLYFNDSEQGYDYFSWYASDENFNFHGFFNSDTNSSLQFTQASFDLKNVPVLGTLTGKSQVYIAFVFESDSTISNYYGAVVDNIVLQKFVGTSAAAPIAITENATNVTTTSASLNGSVNPNNSSTDVLFEYGTSTAYGNFITSTPSTITGTTNVSVTASLTGLQANTIYHYRVSATNSGGTTNGSDATFTTSQVFTYPSQITLNKSFTFANTTQSTSYRMIGLPGNINLPISTFTSGTQKKDWNVFYDNGADTDFLLEFNGQATFNFTPGKGFWALSRNAITVPSQQVNTVTLLGNNTFTIPLHSGWNIISNPFEKDVNWSDVQNINGLTTNNIIHAFSGSFAASATFRTYEGYYYFNDNNRASLNIPYPTTLGKVIKQENLTDRDGTLKISLSKNREIISTIAIGFNPNSKFDFDEMDYVAPPNYFEDISMNLINQNLSINYKKLFIEQRPEIGEGQIFNIEIKNKTEEKIILSADGINNFESYEIYLLDERLNKLYDLREQNRIDISPIHQESNYSLLIGSKDFIYNKKETLMPGEFALHQNYPNPFNPTTVITYQVPNIGTGNALPVQLKVYDILGNEIASLVNEEQTPGIYEVEFGGSNLSSGIYFYEIYAGNFREIKKMSLIK